MNEVNERTQRTSLLRGPVTDIPGLTTYLAATYLPLAGGSLEGDLNIGGYRLFGLANPSDDQDAVTLIYLSDVIDATEAYASNAANLASGTVPDARLSANVARRDQANTFVAANKLPAGSAASPSLLFGSDTNTGFWQPAANQIGITVQGTDVFRWATAGLVYCFATDFRAYGTIKIGSAAGDITLVRNATGPTFQTQSAGGLKVCNADGSAVAAVQASQGRFSGSNASPPIVLRSSNAGWGGTISFGEGSSDYLNITSSVNRIYIYGSGPLTLANIAGTVGVSLDQSVDGVLSVRDRNASALASVNCANLTASGTVTGATVVVTPVSGDSKLRLNNYLGTARAYISATNPDEISLRNSGDTASTASLICGAVTASGNVQGTFRPTQFTVATLPSAAANTGRTVQVTDSSVDFPGNIGNTVAGGGANNVDVKSNGTNWRITG